MDSSFQVPAVATFPKLQIDITDNQAQYTSIKNGLPLHDPCLNYARANQKRDNKMFQQIKKENQEIKKQLQAMMDIQKQILTRQ